MATALMPVDPAGAQQQVNRILPIRANLLPDEITATRNARQSRLVMIGAVLVVLIGIGGWYVAAHHDVQAAADEQTGVNTAISQAQAQLKGKELVTVTTVTTQTDAMATRLKNLTAMDVPWSTMFTNLQKTATAKTVTLTAISAAVSAQDASSTGTLPTGVSYSTIGTLTLTGSAGDKNTVAAFIVALDTVKGVSNAFLTTASQLTSSVSFTITANINSAAECGRYTTKCTSGS